MDKLAAFEIVKLARALTKDVASQASPKTLEQYRAAYARMEARGLTPEKIAGTRRSFYFYRAALTHHLSALIRSGLTAADRAAKRGDEALWLANIHQLKPLIDQLQNYRPDPNLQRINDSRAVGGWSVEAERRARNGQPSARTRSKRNHLRQLPRDWRERLFTATSGSKYRDAVAILWLTGARPAELGTGVSVFAISPSTIRIQIQGVKTHGGKFGQALRQIDVTDHGPAGRHLHDRAADGAITVMSRPGPLSEYIRYVGMKTFPGLSQRISPYSFRHQFAADLKGSGVNSSDVSTALGHSVDETKRYYGTAQHAKATTSVLGVKGSRLVREKTPTKLRALENTRSRERGYSRSKP